MAPSTLAPGFSLRQGTDDDATAIWNLAALALDADPLYFLGKGTSTHDAMVKWMVDTLAPRWAAPDIDTYVIVEDATGHIVAWTALEFPWKDRPLPDDIKAAVQSHDSPPLLKEMDPEGMVEFFNALSCTVPFGYDMENDYHRKGTMVHPDYQKKGFGTFLTRHCNAISDKTGGRTFAPARPTSQKMFENEGYKILGFYDSHFERWGDQYLSVSKTAAMVRDAPS